MSKDYKITFEEIKNILLERGYTYVDGEYRGIKSKLTCLDEDGYLVLCDTQHILYRNRGARPFHSSNPYSIQNIKKFVFENTNDEYECVSDKYINNREPLLFRHKKCGRVFENKWINVYRNRYTDKVIENKTGLFCPFCDAKQLESTHALVLKQVWLHEESDTIVEDKSCVNPNTHCPLPTDIVNHRLKIAIEVQSWFHDFEDQKKKDEIKKNFWISKGYEFYAVDHRDYTVLEMVQLFFPKINSIPDYIDFEYSNKFDDVLAQKLLNETMSVSRVAEIMHCTSHKIYDAIYNNRISYPDNYTNTCFASVVQLDLNGNFIAVYDTIKNAIDKTGVKHIAYALQKGRNYSGGYYWVYKKDYDSGNYTLSEFRSKKFLVPINQFDLEGNFIRRFDTIIEASKAMNCSNNDIYRVAIDERKHCKGYIWKF